MKKSISPAQLSYNSSDAIAMFKNGTIVYATDAFGKLYNHLKSNYKKNFKHTLHELNQALQKSGKAFTPKQVVLKSGDREIDIYVYLLNKSESMENHLLLLADPAGHGPALPVSISAQSF